MATGRHLRGVWWIGAAEDTYRLVVQTVVHLCAIRVWLAMRLVCVISQGQCRLSVRAQPVTKS